MVHTPPPLDGGQHGGSLLYYRRDIPFHRIPLRTALQAVAARVHLDRTYTVCSIYLPPNEDISRQTLEDLIRELPRPFLLLGDMNARHNLWGDYSHNGRGEMIFKMVEESTITVLNSGEPTHFHVQTGSMTAIDLSICSPDINLDFKWEVGYTLRGSDHYPIALQTVLSEPQSCAPKWCLSRADWETYRVSCTLDQSVWDFNNVDEAVEHFLSRLHLAASTSIPRTSGIFHRRPTPWWNHECWLGRRATRRAYARLRAQPTSEALRINFLGTRARYRRILKDAKEGSWRSYVSSINSSTPMTKIWQRVRKMKGKYTPPSPPILQINGQEVADTPEVAEKFAAHFASVSQSGDNDPFAEQRLRDEEREIDFSSRGGENYNVPFDLRELCEALRTCDDTTPGPDDIPYAMLRHLHKQGQEFLLDLYNRIWVEGSFPRIWSAAIVLPIPKPGKDHSNVTNFRPISLTSCLCKLFEKMVNYRLVWVLEKEKFFTPAQCGFRKHHSTTNALLALESSICRAFASKLHHLTIFFDLEKAYDTAWRHGILKTLHEIGLRGRMPVLIKNFLTNRVIRVRIKNTTSDDYSLTGGIPQGSVLSVTLFGIAINGIINILPKDVLSTLYADDLSISFAASKMAVAERRLQLAIDKIHEWASYRGFRFSVAKTVVVHFCKNRGLHPDPDLYLNGNRIPCKEEARFLGLVFDRKLTWIPHLRSLKVSCLQALNLLKVLAHTTWGADRKTLLKLHETLVLSKLEYGCEVYASATPSRLRMLDSIHHAGVRLATGAFKSSPIPSLLVDAGFLPLEERRKKQILSLWYRLKRTPHSAASKKMTADSGTRLYSNRHSLAKPFGCRARDVLTELSAPDIKISEVKTTKMGPWLFPEVTSCKCISDRKDTLSPQAQRAMFLDHFYNGHRDTVPIFTDGSKSDGGVGFSVVFPSLSRSFSIPTPSSIFTAELRAILYSLSVIYVMPETDFTIFSDSLSALQAMKSSRSPHPIVVEILEWLFLNKKRGKTVGFCWVPAHVGVAGNEEADRLAKSASNCPPVRSYAVPAEDIRPLIRRSLLNAWQEKWTNIGPNKLRAIRPTAAPFTYHGLSRRWETALARLRIGHSRETHGFLMEGSPPPYCDDCIVPLTVKHLLAECPSLGELRERHLGAYRMRDDSYELSIILGEESCGREGGTLRFIEEAGLLSKI